MRQKVAKKSGKVNYISNQSGRGGWSGIGTVLDFKWFSFSFSNGFLSHFNKIDNQQD